MATLRYNITAVSVTLWFNTYGDHDHNGKIYILSKHKDILASLCPCGDDSVLRRVLAEDELHFYVSQTGVDDPSNEMGAVPFHCSKGRPLQGFPKLWTPPHGDHRESAPCGENSDGWGYSSGSSRSGECCGSLNRRMA